MLVLRCCGCVCWMCVLYVSFGSKVRPRTFGCVAMGSALLFCLDLVRGCFVLSRQKLCVGMVVCISWLHSYLCV